MNYENLPNLSECFYFNPEFFNKWWEERGKDDFNFGRKELILTECTELRMYHCGTAEDPKYIRIFIDWEERDDRQVYIAIHKETGCAPIYNVKAFITREEYLKNRKEPILN